MFTKPAVDLLASTGRGQLGRRKSRVRGLPEFGGELPVAALAEEILTEGSGQIRGLITVAGNPVLSTPNGVQLERALHLALETVELVGHADARDTLGYVYLRSGDSEAALEQFRRALELSETDPQAEFHYHLGPALAEQGQNERAAMAFQEALNLDPDLPGAADALAKIEGHARAASPREPS